MSDGIQVALAVFGLTALSMAMSKNARLHRWAPVVGLAGQPWWLLYAVRAEAWGLLTLSLAYSAAYVHGIWSHWRKA